jgi:hypothetical protein
MLLGGFIRGPRRTGIPEASAFADIEESRADAG